MTDLVIPIYLLAILFCFVAFFYSSVGLGGGSSYTDLVPYLPLFIAVLAGGICGSCMGSIRFAPRTMERILGSILVVAVFFLGEKIVTLYV